MTGTATLNIHVNDQNDNVPQPTEDDLSVCVSDSLTTTNITAFDPDGTPFGGPFVFELLGDVKNKWKLNPSHGKKWLCYGLKYYSKYFKNSHPML